MRSFPEVASSASGTPARPVRPRRPLASSLTRWLIPAAAALGLLLSLPAALNQSLWDALNRSLPAPPDKRVLVVGIDDATLSDYGRIDTWNRSLYARALNTLNEAGVRATALDILFAGRASGDAALSPLLESSRVVVATAPEDPRGQELGPSGAVHAQTGLSLLNIDADGVVRKFQRSYKLPDGTLYPSLSERLAQAAGIGVQASTVPQTLRYIASDRNTLPVISFRDLVNGNVSYASLQDKLVLIGLTASGSDGANYLDVARQPVPGVLLQARAVSSLLSAPFQTVPLWSTMLLGLLAATITVLLRNLWGFWLALAAVGISVPLWLANIQFPGLTISLGAIAGLLLLALERWLQLRQLGVIDPLTGLGNRLAFTRAMEMRWAIRAERPLGLLLVDLSSFRETAHRLGAHAGDALFQQLAATLSSNKRRGDMVFRWGADEFLILVDNTDAQQLARFATKLQTSLSEMGGQTTSGRPSIGYAVTSSDLYTPTDLIERASRMRYRNKYRDDQST
ncbi:CHASE2 domain-containing protein [Deinococcus ruber]|uniref:Diguanylate cyclase n=1 Tax=Deinococcus ruber TaxID=1848197 RepID=A0A918CJ52_9DEIO|nr:CHASE2 domain-containing protein [Deinococcus ruber]GGR24317.1 diguanylate cyclase [Deinococcus ruber]